AGPCAPGARPSSACAPAPRWRCPPACHAPGRRSAAPSAPRRGRPAGWLLLRSYSCSFPFPSLGGRRCCGGRSRGGPGTGGRRGGLLVARGVALEDAGRRELAELVPDHVFVDQHRHVLATVV